MWDDTKVSFGEFYEYETSLSSDLDELKKINKV